MKIETFTELKNIIRADSYRYNRGGGNKVFNDSWIPIFFLA